MTSFLNDGQVKDIKTMIDQKFNESVKNINDVDIIVKDCKKILSEIPNVKLIEHFINVSADNKNDLESLNKELKNYKQLKTQADLLRDKNYNTLFTGLKTKIVDLESNRDKSAELIKSDIDLLKKTIAENEKKTSKSLDYITYIIYLMLVAFCLLIYMVINLSNKVLELL